MPKPGGGGGQSPPPNSGAAVGPYTFTGAATGSAPAGGSAATTYTLTMSATGSAPAAAPAALSIGFVHDNPTPSAADNTIVGWFEARGDTVTLIDETTTPPTSGYDVIVVSESGSASKAAAYDTCPLPVVSLEVNWSAFRLTTANAASSSSSADLDLTGSHPVNTGFADPLTVYSYALAQYTVPTSSVAAGAVVTAFTGGDTTRAACVVAETGAPLTSGTAPNRRAVIGYIDPTVGNVTTSGRDYLLALVDWAAGTGGASPSPASGTASGTFAFTGAATGSRISRGTGIGVISWTSSTSGSRPSAGTSVGTYTYTGTAAGTAPAVGAKTGTAVGTFTVTGTAGGTRPAGGTTTGTYTITGTATGTNLIQPARDIAIAASPITTGWSTMPATNNPTTAGPVTCCTVAGSPVGTTWTAGPIYLEEL